MALGIIVLTMLGVLGCAPTNTISPTAVPASFAQQTQATATPQPQAQATPVLSGAPSDSFTTAVRDVAKAVSPSVVQVTNEVAAQSLNLSSSSQDVPAGVGSGVIYDAKGYIITNNHVVEGADKLVVALPDGRSFPATLIGRDPKTDIAVIQIQADNLPVAQLGDSSQLQIGDWVVAIGNALALPGGATVTQGVVSALGRAVQEPANQSTGAAGPFLFDLIQTDAPINPGNSGGPLVTLDGKVIGINTLGGGNTSSGTTVQDINFSISINTAKKIADELVSTGKAVHPYVGISYIPLTPSVAAQLGIPQTQGIIIGNVVAGSPAATAGLQAKDVITAVDGTQLVGESDFANIISGHQPGDTVTFTVLRSGQQMQVQVTLGTASTP
jgi:serine protease Do